MDPMSALSVAAAVVQFVDFGSKLLEKASEIYRSHSDKSREEVESDLITQDLRFLVARLKENARPKVLAALTKEETVLEELRERCESIGNELMNSFSIANQRARNRKDGKIGRAWLSFSLAVRLMWKREDVDELRKRLSSLRDQLHLHISVDLLDQVEALNTKVIDQHRQTVSLITDGHDRIVHTSIQTATKTRGSVTRLSRIIERRSLWAFFIILLASAIPFLWTWSTTQIEKNSQLQDEITNWISSTDFSQKQSNVFSLRYPGTGDWLLETAEFNEWLGDRNQTLWLEGIPGSGKTVLASVVIDYLQRIRARRDMVVSYVYYDYQDSIQQTPKNIISSILKDVVRSLPLSAQMIKFYLEHNQNQKVIPTLRELIDILRQEMKRCASVFLIIDALDESPDEQGSRGKLLKELRTLEPFMRLMVTSRPHINVTNHFLSSKRLAVLATKHDIQRYVEIRISDDTRHLARVVEGCPALQKSIVEAVINKANGVFLLAQLHMDSLEQKVDRRAVRRALEELPMGLEDAHRKAIERIESQNQDSRNVAEGILSWLTFAHRPMTVTELQVALAVEPGEKSFNEEGIVDRDYMLTVCMGLVVIEQGSEIIRFVHFSTQEYFQRIAQARFPNGQEMIAKACLTFLSYDIFAGTECSTDLKSFYAYAAKHWGYHARGEAEIALEDQIYQFLETSQFVCAERVRTAKPPTGWADIAKPEGYVKQEGPLWAAAVFGLNATIKRLCEQGSDINTTAYAMFHLPCESVLEIASKDGHRQSIAQSFDNGPYLGIPGIPLIRAAITRNRDLVSLLLDAGADLEWHSSALEVASFNGHNDVVQLLLNKEIGEDGRGVKLGDASAVASTKGHVDTVRLLLQKSAPVNFEWYKPYICIGCHNYGRKPKHVSRTEPQWTERLRSKYYGLIFHLRLWKGSQRIFNPPRECENPLHCAAFHNNAEVCRLLLDYGADVNATGGLWGTALQAASRIESLEIVQLLVEAGANVNAPGPVFGDALQAASISGHEPTVTYLLEKGANIGGNGGGAFYGTALEAAIMKKHDHVARLLLGRYSLTSQWFTHMCDIILHPFSLDYEIRKRWCYPYLKFLSTEYNHTAESQHLVKGYLMGRIEGFENRLF